MSTGAASCWKVDASNLGFHGTLAYHLAISSVSLVRLHDLRSFGLAWGLMVGLRGLPATGMQLGPGAGWLASSGLAAWLRVEALGHPRHPTSISRCSCLMQFTKINNTARSSTDWQHSYLLKAIVIEHQCIICFVYKWNFQHTSFNTHVVTIVNCTFQMQ